MRWLAFVFLLVFGVVIAACGGTSEPVREGGSGDTPAAEPAPAPATPPAAEYRTVADVFPEAPEKALVMNSCASCHNVACSAIGQRSAERWDALRDSHEESRVGCRRRGHLHLPEDPLRREQARTEDAARVPRGRVHTVLRCGSAATQVQRCRGSGGDGSRAGGFTGS